MARAPLRLINLIPNQPTPIDTLRREPVQWVDAIEDANVAFCWPQDVRQVKSDHKHLLVVAVQPNTSPPHLLGSLSEGGSTPAPEDSCHIELGGLFVEDLIRRLVFGKVRMTNPITGPHSVGDCQRPEHMRQTHVN